MQANKNYLLTLGDLLLSTGFTLISKTSSMTIWIFILLIQLINSYVIDVDPAQGRQFILHTVHFIPIGT